MGGLSEYCRCCTEQFAAIASAMMSGKMRYICHFKDMIFAQSPTVGYWDGHKIKQFKYSGRGLFFRVCVKINKVSFVKMQEEPR